MPIKKERRSQPLCLCATPSASAQSFLTKLARCSSSSVELHRQYVYFAAFGLILGAGNDLPASQYSTFICQDKFSPCPILFGTQVLAGLPAFLLQQGLSALGEHG